MQADIVLLGASSLDEETGAVRWQANVPIHDDTEDIENLGEIDAVQALGVASRPYPKDEAGFAEGILLRGCGGRSAVCVAARDTRTARIVGNLEPGDTAVHSTGPNQAAQLLLKEQKKQAVLLSKDSRDNAMVLVLDGKNDKVQIAARGAIFEINASGDVSIASSGGAAILLQGQDIHILGTLHLPGMSPGMALMQGPLIGSPGGAGAAPMTAVKGVGK